MICQRESDAKKEKENTKKYNFQGQSARSRRWFDLDHEWLDENFSTRKPYFYSRLYQNKFRGDDKKTYQKFGVLIIHAKITGKVQFYPEAPVIKYHQKRSNSCCLSSLTSYFHCISDNRHVPSLVNIIEETLTLQTENCKNIIHFVNSIMLN